MIRRSAVATVVFALLAAPASAAAQATQVVTSSVEVALLRDDNVMWKPIPVADQVWRISPGVLLTRETGRSRLMLDGEFDAERYRQLSSLTTMGARQHAALGWQVQPEPGRAFSMDAGYDNSVNPTDLNVQSGLILGRLRAWQWFGKPGYTHTIDQRHSIVTSYRLGGEHTELTPRTITHAAEVGVMEHLSGRDDVYPSYTAEIFQFQGTETRFAHLGLVRWTHRLAPSVRTTLAGGARLYGGEVHPNVQAGIARRAGFAEASAGFTWNQVTAIGVTDLVDVKSVQASAEYTGPTGTGGFVSGSFYRTTLDDDTTNVFRISGGVAVHLAGPLALTVSSALDHQQGSVGQVFAYTPPLLTLGPAYPLLAAPAAPLQRVTFVVALRIAATARSAAGPRTQEDENADAERERPRGGRRR